jgi:hypothetical protein
MMSLLILFALVIFGLTTCVDGFSALNTALLQRLQTIQTELLVSIGRIPGTAMPPHWAESGDVRCWKQNLT